MDTVVIKRHVATLKAYITLTKVDELKKMPGYMEPVADDKIINEEEFKKNIEKHFNRTHDEAN